MLNQRLQQKMLQKLSPQQIQLIKLLELPTLQLEQRIKKEIEENPVLEEGKEKEENETEKEETESEYDDEFSVDDYINDEDTPDYRLHVNNYSKDDKKVDMPYSEGFSLQEYLLDQLSLKDLTTETKALAVYLIGSLDEAGYLRRDIESIVDDLAFSLNIMTEDKLLEDALSEVQTLDPPGIGARDLQECLLLQVARKTENSDNDEYNILLKSVYSVLNDFFEEFSKKHYNKITQKLDIDNNYLKLIVEEILKLNPKPGSVFAGNLNKTAQHINPDFILEIVDGDPVISLNQRNVPDLRISKTYSNLLQGYKKKKKTSDEKNAVTFVKQKLDAAKWFIDALKQRQNTLLHTMSSIVNYQKEYFWDGDETKMRPMILKDISDITGLDISTISRVANSKYIQTHFGIFPLKYFFSEGMETEDGAQVSTREIKHILNECIENENKKKPLTDEKLAKILQEKGYLIARRTVAKYREQLGILVARLRKEL